MLAYLCTGESLSTLNMLVFLHRLLLLSIPGGETLSLLLICQWLHIK